MEQACPNKWLALFWRPMTSPFRPAGCKPTSRCLHHANTSLKSASTLPWFGICTCLWLLHAGAHVCPEGGQATMRMSVQQTVADHKACIELPSAWWLTYRHST